MAFPASAISSPISLVISYRSYHYSSRPLGSISYASQLHSYSCSCRHIPSCFPLMPKKAKIAPLMKQWSFSTQETTTSVMIFLSHFGTRLKNPPEHFSMVFYTIQQGAMMELGEGLCKLRKMNFKAGPFYEFEQQISATLDFIYQTQIVFAACGDDVCVAMDRSDRSYQLLGQYAAGQQLYTLQQAVEDAETMYIVFRSQRSYGWEPLTVKLPTLDATIEHLSSHGL